MTPCGAVSWLLYVGGPGQPLGEVVAVLPAQAEKFAGHVGLQKQQCQLVVQLP